MILELGTKVREDFTITDFPHPHHWKYHGGLLVIVSRDDGDCDLMEIEF